MSSKVKWVCQTGQGWEWVSANGGSNALGGNVAILKGTVDLEPNPDFWYLCATLVTGEGGNADPGTVATVFVRHYVDSTHGPVVQAGVIAEGSWSDISDPSAAFSTTGAAGKSGGINLVALLD